MEQITCLALFEHAPLNDASWYIYLSSTPIVLVSEKKLEGKKVEGRKTREQITGMRKEERGKKEIEKNRGGGGIKRDKTDKNKKRDKQREGFTLSSTN